MQHPKHKIFLCDILNPVSDKKAQLIRKGAIALKLVTDKASKRQVYRIQEVGKEKEILNKYAGKVGTEVVDMVGQVAMPSFFDMHFHWVQDDVREMPKANLLEWLSKYTWPYESKFQDRKYSIDKALDFAQKLCQVGTLGGACYSSLHAHSADDALKYFPGDFTVGNVLMDINSPDYLTHSAKEAIKMVETQTKKYGPRYAVTPRFAITTSPEVMLAGAKAAKKNKSFIQTHLCETTNEIEFVLSIYKNIKGFEKVKNYTEIYKKCGILSSKTIMGHCIHMSKEELEMMQKSKTSIAHCPTSNGPIKELGLGSGLFDFKKTEKYGIRWALASDIGGGPFLSMFDVMRSFVEQNKAAKRAGASYTKALYRSTIAGAEMMGLQKLAGSLDKGKKANIIFVDSAAGTSAEKVLEKMIGRYRKDRAHYSDMVNYTYWEGHEVYAKEE